MSALVTDIAGHWSGQQSAALDAIEAWLTHGDGSPFYLAGHAGTGKTTLAKEIGRRAGDAVALVIDESRVFRADRWRWLYTAITRAADRVTVVQP
jgi:MoxR-like ATPase